MIIESSWEKMLSKISLLIDFVSLMMLVVGVIFEIMIIVLQVVFEIIKVLTITIFLNISTYLKKIWGINGTHTKN